MEFLFSKFGQLVMAAIPVGAISFALFQIVKRQSAWIDRLDNPLIKQALVLAVAVVLTAAFSAVGLTIDCVPGENCLALVNEDKIAEFVKAVLGAFTAFALHAVKNGATKRKR